MKKHTTKALNTLLIFAILCAFCIAPVAAATTTENVPILFSKRIYGVDGIEYLVYDETNPHPVWEYWFKDGDIVKFKKLDNGQIALYSPNPPPPTGSAWPLPGAMAVAPAFVPAAAVAMAENAAWVAAAAAGIYYVNEVANECLSPTKTHQYNRLDGKYNHRKDCLLSYDKALDFMKDCNPRGPKEKEDNIWIGSTEEGCKALAEAATKILGGEKPVFHPGSTAQPPHYHASSPYEHHCKPHCFWDYENFFKKRE